VLPSSTLITRSARLAQNSVELPEPYSKTVLPDRSSCWRYSMAGYVNQGMGRPAASTGLRDCTDFKWP